MMHCRTLCGRGPPALHGGAIRWASSKAGGLIGLPNVGKSTLFNGLVRAQKAVASNRPFATIDPNIATVEVPDKRLPALKAVAGSAKTIGWSLDLHDIAGLIKGASEGAGLGNAFLGHIRTVNVLFQIVRCFDDANVVHVEDGAPDPCRDIAILEQELLLADLQSCEKRLDKSAKARTPEAAAQQALLRRAREVMEDGKPARVLEGTLSKEDALLWPKLQLLTQKRMMYVCNVGEGDLRSGGNAMTAAVRDFLGEHLKSTTAASGSRLVADQMLTVSAQIEAEASLLSDEDRDGFLAEYGLQQTGLDAVILKAADLLGLHSYFTTGPMETRSWCIPQGATAVEAAGAIHSDLSAGFIKAEVISYADFMRVGGERQAKEANLIKAQGKDYVVADGDVITFKTYNSQGAKR